MATMPSALELIYALPRIISVTILVLLGLAVNLTLIFTLGLLCRVLIAYLFPPSRTEIDISDATPDHTYLRSVEDIFDDSHAGIWHFGSLVLAGSGYLAAIPFLLIDQEPIEACAAVSVVIWGVFIGLELGVCAVAGFVKAFRTWS